MKKSLTILCAVLILMSFSLSGFGQTNFFDVSQATPPKAIPAKDMTVFVIVKASEDEFWQIVLDGAAKGAKHFGVKFIHQEPSSESEISKQISILETAISTKPDAIVLAPTVSDSLTPGIEKAMDSGIPVILIDSPANTDNFVSFLGSDNYYMGQKAADELAKSLESKKGKPTGEVAAIKFVSGVDTEEQRLKGFLDRIEEKYSDIKVIAIKESMGQRANVITITNDLLTAFPKLDGIFSTCEMVGDGVVRALDMMNKKGLTIISIDASPQQIWGLENGYLDVILVQQPWLMGYAGVAYAVMARNGVPLAKYVDTGILVVTKESLISGEIDAAINPFEYYKDW